MLADAVEAIAAAGLRAGPRRRARGRRRVEPLLRATAATTSTAARSTARGMIDALADVVPQLPDRQRRGRPGGGRLGRTGRGCGEALGPGALVLGDDFLCTNPARIRRAVDGRRGDRAAAEGEPDRHADRGGRRAAGGAGRRLARDGQRPQRRDRRRLAGRPGRRVGRRPDQGRLDHAVRAAGEVQPAAGDRGGDGTGDEGMGDAGMGG